MKRLLAYLFIVLGLGLTFTVNAESEEYICFDDYNETEVKVYLETRNNTSYDICVGKQEHWWTYYFVWHFRNDITVKKEIINERLAGSYKELNFQFKVYEKPKIAKAEPKQEELN